jgi:hypothetical protein
MKTYFVKSYNVNYPVLDLEVQVDEVDRFCSGTGFTKFFLAKYEMKPCAGLGVACG